MPADRRPASPVAALGRRRFIAAAGSAAALAAAGCGGGSSAPAAGPATPTGPSAIDWPRLAASLQGRLLRPGDADYPVAARVFNAAYDAIAPQAVARCATAADVVQALAFARANGLAVTPRSGGHGYTGDSTGTGLVIDVGGLDAISIDASAGTATIGAGAKLVDVYDQLASRGVCIPSGSCPTIGIAGITQGGGIGVVDRAHGLTCDSLVSVQVVLADGRSVTCDAANEPDLFWALRGGGGGQFGIVTSLTFRTFATRDVTRFSAGFAWTDAAAVLAAWQAWPQSLPDAGWAGLVLVPAATSLPPVIEIDGLFLGSADDFAPIWSALLDAAGATPTWQSVTAQSFRDAMLVSCPANSWHIDGPKRGER